MSFLLAAAVAANLGAEWNPPARYDFPYPGETVTELLHPFKVPGACRRLLAGTKWVSGVNQTQRGCAIKRGAVCYIVAIDRPYYGTTPAAVIRHETGHCNGWHGSHPD